MTTPERQRAWDDDRLSAYFDGEMTGEKAMEIQQKLAGDAEARQLLDRLAQIREQFQWLPKYELGGQPDWKRGGKSQETQFKSVPGRLPSEAAGKRVAQRWALALLATAATVGLMFFLLRAPDPHRSARAPKVAPNQDSNAIVRESSVESAEIPGVAGAPVPQQDLGLDTSNNRPPQQSPTPEDDVLAIPESTALAADVPVYRLRCTSPEQQRVWERIRQWTTPGHPDAPPANAPPEMLKGGEVDASASMAMSNPSIAPQSLGRQFDQPRAATRTMPMNPIADSPRFLEVFGVHASETEFQRIQVQLESAGMALAEPTSEQKDDVHRLWSLFVEAEKMGGNKAERKEVPTSSMEDYRDGATGRSRHVASAERTSVANDAQRAERNDKLDTPTVLSSKEGVRQPYQIFYLGSLSVVEGAPRADQEWLSIHPPQNLDDSAHSGSLEDAPADRQWRVLILEVD